MEESDTWLVEAWSTVPAETQGVPMNPRSGRMGVSKGRSEATQWRTWSPPNQARASLSCCGEYRESVNANRETREETSGPSCGWLNNDWTHRPPNEWTIMTTWA